MADTTSQPEPRLALTREGKNYADNCNCFGLIGFNGPFWAAVEEGDHELVSTLLAGDLTLLKKTKPSDRRLSAWHLAAKNGHTNVLQELREAVLSCGEESTKLNSSLRRVFAVTCSGESLLHKFVNWDTFTSQTPLILACRNGHKEAASFLLSSGANPWVGDAEGLTALHYAARHNHWEVIRALLQRPPPFSRAASRLNKSNRAYIEVLDLYGYTPLHHAAAERNLDAVVTLLAHGADMIARTWFQSGFYPHFPRGMTALHIAAWRGHLPIAKHIVKTYFESNGNLLPAQTSPTEQQQRARQRPDPRQSWVAAKWPCSLSIR
ncbi:ankyrin repeat-containing domain protein [Dunaliella salina]|uniref:Ankyrin repeat-containing domain protein n=1 Tax=Dunaliella salina TaxID=3046 RepID=A0ABQ7GBR1_DUNSA|nr:ankyrin repeat-containing domain protein [Dunaliella salina]|eukprot:KAF5832038.1 ankyrin repeat-containing domain protein [Dunaliella salina]